MTSCFRRGRDGRETGEVTKNLAPLTDPQKKRAARRLTEVAYLVCFRAEHGRASEPAGLVKVKANALAVRGDLSPRGPSPGCPCGASPRGPALDPQVLESIVDHARGSSRLLSNDGAGRLLKFTLFEFTQLEEELVRETGKTFSTLNPYDEEPSDRELRRKKRELETDKRASKNYRDRKKAREKDLTNVDVTSAKDLTNNDVTNYHVTNVRPVSRKKDKDPDAPDVTNPGPTRAAVMEAVASGAATAPDIVKVTTLPYDTVRQTLVRLHKDGLLTRPGRGTYALADQRGAQAPAHVVIANTHGTSAAVDERGAEAPAPRLPKDTTTPTPPPRRTTSRPLEGQQSFDFISAIAPPHDPRPPQSKPRSQAGRLKRTRLEREDLSP